MHTTGTNVPAAQRKRHAFDAAFLTEDTRTGLDWPADIWAAIEAARVDVCMTAAQTRMSWGEPRACVEEGGVGRRSQQTKNV